jgi:hypothetical protein
MGLNFRDFVADTFDYRLTCFSGFDTGDVICMKGCALALNCAMAKNSFLSRQIADDWYPIYRPYGPPYETD